VVGEDADPRVRLELARLLEVAPDPPGRRAERAADDERTARARDQERAAVHHSAKLSATREVVPPSLSGSRHGQGPATSRSRMKLEKWTRYIPAPPSANQRRPVASLHMPPRSAVKYGMPYARDALRSNATCAPARYMTSVPASMS